MKTIKDRMEELQHEVYLLEEMDQHVVDQDYLEYLKIQLQFLYYYEEDEIYSE